MNRFTEEQVGQLAPDAASLKSGKDLANAKKWLTLRFNERVLWGEVQGSGKDPYRTSADLVSTAFKCSCPSRKFPCKHGLGLLLIFAKSPDAVSQSAAEPAWVQEWMDKRQTKAETAAAPKPPGEVDEKTEARRAKGKEKREQERLDLVQAGAAELELWLKDLLRAGFLGLPEKGLKFFEKTAARMVDAKATGLANQVRNFTKINFYSGTEWHSEALETAAETYLLLEAFKNIDQLPPAVQEDVRNLIGWNLKKNELLEDASAETIADQWLVLWRLTEQEDTLTVQKNWLLGMKTGRTALILDFAYKNAPLQNLLMPGASVKAELVFYPSNMPFRAIIKTQGVHSSEMAVGDAALPAWKNMQAVFAEKIRQFPWADEIPFYLSKILVTKQADTWYLQDCETALLQVNNGFGDANMLRLLALTGGNATDMFVLRKRNTVIPLGVMIDQKFRIVLT